MQQETVQRQTFSVDEFAKIIGISRGSAYVQVNTGAVKSIRLGKRLLVPRVEIERLLAGEPARA